MEGAPALAAGAETTATATAAAWVGQWWTAGRGAGGS